MSAIGGEEMAAGASASSGATSALALTGVAGPATEDDVPVGTVFVGLAVDGVDAVSTGPSAARRSQADPGVLSDQRSRRAATGARRTRAELRRDRNDRFTARRSRCLRSRPPSTPQPSASTSRLERITRIRWHVAHGRLARMALCRRPRRRGRVGRSGGRRTSSPPAGQTDTIWRIYSMTKPVTSIAAMILHEEGCFDLNDEVARWLPGVRHTPCLRAGPAGGTHHPARDSSPCASGTCSRTRPGSPTASSAATPVDAIYRHRGYEWGSPSGHDLAASSRDLAYMPLALRSGHRLELLRRHRRRRSARRVCGQSCRSTSFFSARILGPLGMGETGFFCPGELRDRGWPSSTCTSLRRVSSARPDGGGREVTPRRSRRRRQASSRRPATTTDLRRCSCRGGVLGAARLVAPSTVALMSRNFLPGGLDIESLARDSFSESSMAGVGFGLGLSCVIDPSRLRMPTSEGTVAWGGAASTTFWVDPQEDLTCVFFTQLLPSSTYPIRRELQRLVYAASSTDPSVEGEPSLPALSSFRAPSTIRRRSPSARA